MYIRDKQARREYQREYMREWRKRNPEKEKELQKKSNDKKKKYAAEYYQNNKERYRKPRQEYYQRRKEYFQQKSREAYLRTKVQVQERSRKRRELVLTHYGKKCVCCGEATIEFLAIDHINNDGYKQRKNIKINIYSWIIKNNYPKDLQILCHNCNLAKAFYGRCPHNDRIASEQNTR